MAKQKRETPIKAGIKKWLQYHGWFVMNILQGLGAQKGISDLIAVKRGYVLFIEIKVPNDPNSKQSPYQIEFEEQIRRHGGHYFVARCYQVVENYIRENCPEAV